MSALGLVDAPVPKMPRWLSPIDAVVGRISLVASVIGAFLIALICLLMVADIVGRSMGKPIVGTLELTKLSIVSIAFLTIPYGMRKGSHVRSTILLGRLPKRAQWVAAALFALLAAAVFALVAYASWDPMLFALRTGEFEGEGALRVPTAPAKIAIVIGSVLIAIESALSIFHEPEPELAEVMP